MEVLYEEYLKSDDKEIQIDDLYFYKILHKDEISINGGTVLITIPWKIFYNSKSRLIILNF